MNLEPSRLWIRIVRDELIIFSQQANSWIFWLQVTFILMFQSVSISLQSERNGSVIMSQLSNLPSCQ